MINIILHSLQAFRVITLILISNPRFVVLLRIVPVSLRILGLRGHQSILKLDAGNEKLGFCPAIGRAFFILLNCA